MSRLWLYAVNPLGGHTSRLGISASSRAGGEMATYASFSCRAWSGDSMPSVVQTSMPMPRTSRTMVRILSKPRLRPARSRHAAPMQKRVLPFSLALRAASRTGSISTRREALVAVVWREDWEQYEPRTQRDALSVLPRKSRSEQVH